MSGIGPASVSRMISAALLGAWAVAAATAQERPYEEIFGFHYREALCILQEQDAALRESIASRGGGADVLISVIFPELLRYSLLRDRMETAGLKIFYVHLGENSGRFGNFSIGLFQMKPAFVEDLEHAVVSFDLMDRFRDVVEYPCGVGVKEIRRMRVNRLESPKWQAVYLACFGEVMDRRFHGTAWESVEDRIGFYATAFNHGFLADEEEIRRWEDAEIFPYGIGYDGKQCAYADVARTFYRKYGRVKQDGSSE